MEELTKWLIGAIGTLTTAVAALFWDGRKCASARVDDVKEIAKVVDANSRFLEQSVAANAALARVMEARSQAAELVAKSLDGLAQKIESDGELTRAKLDELLRAVTGRGH